jgi:hypothetical protein
MQILPRGILSIFLFNLALLCSVTGRGQNFEGEILFVKQTLKDTSYLSYKIKGNKVRFEELNKDFQIDNYLIADLSKKSIYAINPKRKLYADLPVYAWNDKPDTTNFKIVKTGNYKLIKGIKCFQWRVLNKKDDTEVQFWTASEKYESFSEFNRLLNHSDKTTQYYLNSTEIYGQLPLESVERSMLREMRMRLEVVNIEKKTLPIALFEIPAGYKLFEKK